MGSARDRAARDPAAVVPDHPMGLQEGSAVNQPSRFATTQEGHAYSDRCMVDGCPHCRSKFLEEHTDTLPDACYPTSSPYDLNGQKEYPGE